jgi:hypothetical protein
MYQSLIWSAVLGDDARRLRSALDSEDLQRLANALVDGVRRDAELGSDLLGIEVLVDEAEAVELPGAQPRHPLRDRIVRRITKSPTIIVRQAVSIFQGNPHLAQHGATPEQRVRASLGHPHSFRQIFRRFAPNRGESALTLVMRALSPEVFRGESSSETGLQIALESSSGRGFREVVIGD